jgi:hypothetical protein
MNRSVASSSTRRRSSDGCALKSNSSRVFVDGNPASRSRLARRLPCCGDLDVEQVVQELRLARLGLLGRLERGGQLLGRGGELEVGEVPAKLLVGGVLVHLATLAICA